MLKKSTTVIEPEIVDDKAVALSLADSLIVQLNDHEEEMQELGFRMWHLCVVMGGKLIALKKSLKHGQFGTLFKPNSEHVRNLKFSQDTAGLYMKLYRQATSRANKQLGKEEAEKLKALCIEDKPKRELTETLNKISTAESMRQALFDFAQDGKTDKAETLKKHRNTKGGPSGKDADAATELALVEEENEDKKRLFASQGISRAVSILEEVFATGSHLLLAVDGRKEVADQLRIMADRLEGKNSRKKAN